MILENDNGAPDLDVARELLDKILLMQLHLMEEKMTLEVGIESSINNGSIHLAKSRYIMGQTSVSTTRLPTEGSPDFSASTLCETSEEDGVKQLNVVQNDADDTVNPLRWFGVLVPQNLHKAQGIFQNSVNFIVKCVNCQMQICNNMTNIQILRKYINTIKS